MKVKRIEKELKDAEKLTRMFIETFDILRKMGGDPATSALRTAIMITMSLSGDERLTNFEIDKYSRIVTAVVDAMLFCKN
jgi:sensor domain CHASE-containing protein